MNIKRAAASAIASKLAAAIPAFAAGGGVKPASDDYELDAKYPALIIVPRQFTFTPFQDDDELLDDADPATAANNLVQVGDFEGLFELRLYALSQYDRGELEQQVLDQFMAGAPGELQAQTAAVVLGGVTTLYAAPIVARLEDEEWHEEFALAKKRYTFLDANVNFPALSMRSAPTISQIQLAIAHDLDASVADETYGIDENGNLTEL